MDPEEERIKLLTRLGRETIIKYGTYDMDKSRLIYQEHPFYAKPEPEKEEEPETVNSDMGYNEMPAGPAMEEPMNDADAAALASQIAGSNFKVGLSQEEVDALLNGMI